MGEANLTGYSKEAFYDLIDTFFVVRGKISKQHARKVKVSFELESAKCRLSASKSDIILGDFEKVKMRIEITF
ncbi:hypothetical protein [Methanolobus psychrotolerans]|uniref:hypothetical protein n=1 Tax=Methanolobus psychrotolerans TaxID=1874706 RepID=UPI000B916711|nr:hypothetical protein [Methanolobus psychrotolerans]